MGLSLRDRIFRELKHGNYRNVLDIAAALDEPDVVTKAALDAMVLDGYVGVDDGNYYIKHVLGPIPEPQWSGFVNYVDILAALPTAEPIPEAYTNPDVKHVVHRDQGGSPSCVGNSVAYGRDLDIIRLTGLKPTDEDFERERRNVEFTPNLWYDVYYRQSMSAEHAYRTSRKVGNVTHPAGSYTSAAMKALKLHGICLHDQWLQPKSGYAAWDAPYPDFVDTVNENAEETAAKHKIAGYAYVETWDDVCRAIHKHGYVLGTIVVWDNYCSCPSDPKLPEPKGSICGAHALCFVGYDKENLYFLHSWWGDKGDDKPTWNKIGHISRSYFNRGFRGAYVVLDDEEAEIAFSKYAHVEIHCATWPDAVLYLSGCPKGRLPLTLMLKINEEYIFTLESDYYGSASSVIVAVPEGTKTITLHPPVTRAMQVRAIVRKVYKVLSRIFGIVTNQWKE